MDTATAEDRVYAVLRDTKTINRESFHMDTYDPETGHVDGRISGQDFAHEIVHALGLCDRKNCTPVTRRGGRLGSRRTPAVEGPTDGQEYPVGSYVLSTRT